MPTPRSRSTGSSRSRSTSRASSSSRSRSSSTRGAAKTTTDHEEIRQWVESHGGHPACVRGTGGRSDTGLLRIDFPGYSGQQSLQEISWEEFFEKFDDQNLAFLYQEEKRGGGDSRFSKLVSRTGTRGRKKTSGSRSSEHKRAAGARRHGRGAE